MQLQTTYHSNNYPIIVEHHAFKYLSEYIQDYDKVFLIIEINLKQYVTIQTFKKLSFLPAKK